MKMNKLIVLLLACCTLSAQAQEALSLQDAVAKTLASNFQIQIQQAQVSIAENNNSWGQTSALPSLSLSAGQNNSVADQSQNPTAFIQDKLQSTGYEYGANLNWTLFDGFNMFASKRQLELLEEQSEGNASLIIENTVQAVVLAYYDVLLQNERLSVLNEVIALSRDRLEYMEVKRELGASTTFEILQFENAIISDSTNYLLQEIAQSNALRNLNLLMGEEVSMNWTLTTPLDAPNNSYAFETVWNEVKSSNQSLKNQTINSMLAAQQTKLAKSGMYPVVSFNAGINQSQSSFSVGDLSGEGQTLSYFGNFALNFNVFNGGRTKRALQNAQINEEIALLSFSDMERQVQVELVNRIDRYNAEMSIFQLVDSNVENQRTALDIVADRFANGMVNSFDYRNAQLNYLNTSLSQIEALTNLLNSHVNLVRLRGGILDMNQSAP